ncbi:MAG: sn-glycerol-1-phosphate dehydrogenase [Turicibacter sp.]
MKINLSQLSRNCSCGKTHALSSLFISNQEDALKEIQHFLFKQEIDQTPLLICDTNTHKLITPAVLNQLNLANLRFVTLPANGLHADEHGLKLLNDQLAIKPTVLLAFGTGTIHDLTRYTAHDLNIPFISVPTGASVDGFASNVAAMTFNGFKVTTAAVAPLAIFADPTLYANAPKQLSAAGVGDLLGKYTALLDWKVAHLLTGEFICHEVIALTEQALTLLVNSLENFDEQAHVHLMDGLILSGIAMQMVGTSRPASGAEHHLSHLWEMHVINDEITALHGEKVGVGLLMVCKEYQKLLLVNESPMLKKFESFNAKSHYGNIFKTLYNDVKKENDPDCLSRITDETLEKQFLAIKELVLNLPKPEELTRMMRLVGAKTTMHELGLSDEIESLSLELAPYVRPRLTLLRVMKRFEI